jgi:hypothetical protein
MGGQVLAARGSLSGERRGAPGDAGGASAARRAPYGMTFRSFTNCVVRLPDVDARGQQPAETMYCGFFQRSSVITPMPICRVPAADQVLLLQLRDRAGELVVLHVRVVLLISSFAAGSSMPFQPSIEARTALHHVGPFTIFCRHDGRRTAGSRRARTGRTAPHAGLFRLERLDDM